MMFDDIDMRNNYNKGFWHGAIASGIGVLIMCFLIGVFL